MKDISNLHLQIYYRQKNIWNKKWSFSLKISSVNVTKSTECLMENFIFCAVKSMKQSKETNQTRTTLIYAIAQFLITIIKVSFLDWALGSIPTWYWDFPNIFNHIISNNFSSRYKVPLYFCWIKPILKSWKISW